MTKDDQIVALQAENARLMTGVRMAYSLLGEASQAINAMAVLGGLMEFTPAPVGESDGTHLIDGEFQSDKYPTTPRGKVPLSCRDATAQDLLWEYAQRRRKVDSQFADDLETALKIAGYSPLPAPDAVLVEGYNKDWRALYKAIGLPEDTTDAKVISDRIMEMRASAGLAVELAEYIFLTDCSDFDRYQWLKAECVRRCPAFFSLVGEDLLLNPARGGEHG